MHLDYLSTRSSEPKGYAVMHGNVVLGQIEQEVDGFYYFWPATERTGFWPSWVLMDIGRKLEALNEAWNQKLEELNVETHPYGRMGDVL